MATKRSIVRGARPHRNSKLTVEQVGFVLAHLADPFYSLREIADRVLTHFGVTINHNTIDDYKKVPRYKEIIAAIREVVVNDLASIPIAKKRVRLQYLEHAARRLTTDHRIDLKVDKDGGEHWLIGQQPQFVPAVVKEARLEMQEELEPGDISLKIKGGPGVENRVSVAQVMRGVADEARAVMPGLLRESLAKAIEAEQKK